VLCAVAALGGSSAVVGHAGHPRQCMRVSRRPWSLRRQPLLRAGA
jgi:hypothetical protein